MTLTKLVSIIEYGLTLVFVTTLLFSAAYTEIVRELLKLSTGTASINQPGKKGSNPLKIAYHGPKTLMSTVIAIIRHEANISNNTPNEESLT